MDLKKKIEKIQEYLIQQEADGWLLYDNHGSNRFVRQLLNISPQQVLTRRFFYWIPKTGNPQKILHKIESQNLEQLPGEKYLYLSWQELEQALHQVLKKAHVILMEYSPRCSNPQVSIVDAGLFEILKEMGKQVQSSADVLQSFTSVLGSKQIASHLEAASVVQKTVARAWDFISDSVRKQKRVTEFDVQNFILNDFASQNCVTEEGPICAVNEHSALPHYMATYEGAKEIQYGDFILIDLWCKKSGQEEVYADITRVAVAAPQPNSKQVEVFEIVKSAQKKAFDFVRERMELGQTIQGYEVDDVCRKYIQIKGYGVFFTHRTGHNIDTSVHGAGANFDHLETYDQRQLLPGMCFSVEPGIYLAGEFGVRLESNMLIQTDRMVKITGGIEENLLCLL